MCMSLVVLHPFRLSWYWASQSDRKSTRLNSSHGYISYAVFCLKKKNKLAQEKLSLGYNIYRDPAFQDIHVRSVALPAVLHHLETIAATSATLLSYVELGTGTAV